MYKYFKESLYESCVRDWLKETGFKGFSGKYDASTENNNRYMQLSEKIKFHGLVSILLASSASSGNIWYP